MNTDIRSQMPVLAHLACRFLESGPYAYYQVNTYVWADGRSEEPHFPAVYRDKAIWWDTERMYGRAWELDHRSTVLTWTGKDLPGSYRYAMIQISANDALRSRV